MPFRTTPAGPRRRSAVSAVLPHTALALALAAALVPPALADEAATAALDATDLDAVHVTGERREQTSASATRLDLTARETPQSVSHVTREQMDDFGLDSVNEVLAATTGVTVEQVETDRTYYTARGFDITSFQVDGLGIPLPYGIQNGDIDTAVYQRVEVLRGANGLMSGTGNPSATVNFVRKRPGDAFEAAVMLQPDVEAEAAAARFDHESRERDDREERTGQRDLDLRRDDVLGVAALPRLGGGAPAVRTGGGTPLGGLPPAGALGGGPPLRSLGAPADAFGGQSGSLSGRTVLAGRSPYHSPGAAPGTFSRARRASVAGSGSCIRARARLSFCRVPPESSSIRKSR